MPDLVSFSMPLTIPVHRGKPIKIGLLKDQIKKSGLTEEEFLKLI